MSSSSRERSRTPAAASNRASASGAGPEIDAKTSGAEDEDHRAALVLRINPIPTATPSIKPAEGLLLRDTSVLLLLDIHQVAVRNEAETARCIERLPLEKDNLAIFFLSYAVRQDTIRIATDTLYRTSSRIALPRPVNFPIIFTSTKADRGTGRGKALRARWNV